MDKYLVINEEIFAKQDISNINLDIVESLTGVYNFDIMECPGLGCTLFLFGDIHVSTDNGFINQDDKSLYLPIYLDALFKKHNDKQFDIILEVPPSKRDITNDNRKASVINSIIKQFSVCYQGISNKVECSKEWPNVRFHNVDIRNMKNDNIDSPFINYTKILDDYYIYFMDLSDSLQDNTATDNDFIELYDIIKNDCIPTLLFDDLDNYVENIIMLMNNDPKFYQYKNIKYNGYAEDFLKSYISGEIEYFGIDELIMDMGKTSQINRDTLSDLLLRLYMLCLNIAIHLMDYYSFIRLMKIIGYGGKNIIIIEGNFHIQNIKNFIRSLYLNEKLILGTEEVDNDIHAWYYYILNKILNKILTENDTPAWDEYDITRTQKTILILENIIDEQRKRASHYSENPESRIFKISSSIIENSLL